MTIAAAITMLALGVHAVSRTILAILRLREMRRRLRDQTHEAAAP
jgi:hypothetical protein